MGALQIRDTTEHDVEAVKALFVDAYGPDYPFTDFYDTGWLKKAVFDDDTMFLVAELDGKVLGTVSVMFATGGLSDLIGEFGRLVVHHEARGHHAGTELLQTALDRVSDSVRFAFAEARTAHSGSQKILEASGFHAVGFEPLKYKLIERESVVLYATHPAGLEDLRRNNPRVIPEIAPLAMHVLEQVGITPDVIVSDADGYPTPRPRGITNKRFLIEDLSERGWSPLLRIERGRVEGREVFGNLSLSHGFFKIRTQKTRYLVARDGAAILGGLGFSHDPIDQKVRIFELIGFDNAVKGALLDEVDRLAREELDAAYIEADVSAYAPELQRTLERLGFMATAYCPSMVFSEVERLDVVRMAKLSAPYFREEIPLTDAAGKTRDIVEFSMLDRREGRDIFRAAGATSIFSGIDEGDTYHLARIGRMRDIADGERLIQKGEAGDRVFVLVSGELRVSVGDREVGRIAAGETVGEMSLLDENPRSANVIAAGDCRVLEILGTDLQELMARRPRLGMALMRNLAVNLSAKLRGAD
ncbi:MAG: GNAT family N-acetyltransferase [Kiritimatiellae bacterium]|nr:GNAT family N-acetyltransferase [Kiritimatiellia bacterium]